MSVGDKFECCRGQGGTHEGFCDVGIYAEELRIVKLVKEQADRIAALEAELADLKTKISTGHFMPGG